MSSLSSRLSELGLWRGQMPPKHLEAASGPLGLVQWVYAGELEGSLSAQLTVEADELLGPLCARVGGRARHLKVVDVLEGPPMEIQVALEGRQKRWIVKGLRELVEQVNAEFQSDDHARWVATLGEWEDCLVLWSVPKSLLRRLFQEGFFRPENTPSSGQGAP